MVCALIPGVKQRQMPSAKPSALSRHFLKPLFNPMKIEYI